jgi:hypothetical protein
LGRDRPPVHILLLLVCVALSAALHEGIVSSSTISMDADDINTDAEQEVSVRVTTVMSTGIERLRQRRGNDNIGGNLRWLVQELSKLLPPSQRERYTSRIRRNMGEDVEVQLDNPSEESGKIEAADTPSALNVTALCACKLLSCDMCTNVTIHCDELLTFEERAVCVEDTKRIKLPDCAYVTKIYKDLAAMDLDKEFMQKEMDERQTIKQDVIVAAVEAQQEKADMNKNGSIEPTELHTLVEGLLEMMNDNAQIGKCTYKPEENAESMETSEEATKNNNQRMT